MFIIRIPVRDFMDHTPIEDASVTVKATLKAFWPAIQSPSGSVPKPAPTILQSESKDSRPLLARNLGKGAYEAAFDLRPMYQELNHKAPNGRLPDSFSLLGTVSVVIGRLDDILSLGTVRETIVRSSDLDKSVVTEPIGVDFAKAIVGATTPSSARLWFAWNGRGDTSGGQFVCEVNRIPPPGRQKPGESSFPLATPWPEPVDFPAHWTEPVDFSEAPKGSNTANLQLRGLSPGATYRYALREKGVGASGAGELGRILATGEVTTPFITSGRLSFVFGSCHQPTNPKSLGRWEALAARRDYNLLLLIGDQIYEDKIEDMGATWEERYWNRYHQYWAHRPMRQVLRRTPTYMIFDDHEVKDDWGVVPLETGREGGALAAYDAFQQAHNPGGSESRNYYYSFRTGPAAFFVLDLRSRRSNDKDYPVLGKAQFDDFRDWATNENREDGARKADVAFVVTTVPIAYLPVQEIRRLLDQLKEAGAGVAGWFGVAAAGIAYPLSLPAALLGYYIGHRAGKKEVEATFRNYGLDNLTKRDLADMWTLKENQPDMSRVLETLFDLANDVRDGGRSGPRPRAVFILGGDVHYGAMHEIVSELPRHARNKTIHQLISSPISCEPPDANNSGTLALQTVIRHLTPGKNITKKDVAKYGEDIAGLTRDLFGDQPAKFPLDDQSRKVFWANFRGLVTERNFGRVAMAEVNDQALYTCWKVSDQPGANWTNWSRMPGAPAQVVDIATVKLPQGGLQLFATDTSNQIYTTWKVSNQPGENWASWIKFPGQARRIAGGNLPRDVPQLWTIGVRGETEYHRVYRFSLSIEGESRPLAKLLEVRLPNNDQEGVQIEEVLLPGGLAEGQVIKGPDQPEVFLVELGERRWVPNEATFLSRWTWDQIRTVPQDVLDAIPRGPDLLQ